MLERGRGLLPKLVVGDNAFLRIPEFDQGPTDPRNLVVVVLSAENNLFVVGTENGRVNRRLERNALEASKCKILAVSDVPDVEHSVRELVRLGSVGKGQGYRRCNCRQKCLSGRCSCKKAGLFCNSACHGG